MKLFIQIPCLNEEDNLPGVISALPARISGISEIEVVVIDDGSTDKTAEKARELGVHHILRNKKTLGLARSFRIALDFCLDHGADIIVNLDGDNQYPADQIPRLIQPLIDKKADIVIGDRQTSAIPHFSLSKKLLQKFGSWVVRKLSHVEVQDTVSGFRSFSREAALRLTILSNYTYTLESILQVSTKGLVIVDVPIRTNPPTRESRLMKSVRSYLIFSAATIIRVFAMYNPLRIFMPLGVLFLSLGSGICLRFLYLYLQNGGEGKVQSLILAAILLITGILVVLVGVIADLIQFNRRLLEDILERVKRLQYDIRIDGSR